MPCGSKERCRTLSVRNVTQAKVLCDTYRDKCKGFVYEAESRTFFGKIDITGMELTRHYCIQSSSSINFTLCARLVQLVASLATNQEVLGSIPGLVKG